MTTPPATLRGFVLSTVLSSESLAGALDVVVFRVSGKAELCDGFRSFRSVFFMQGILRPWKLRSRGRCTKGEDWSGERGHEKAAQTPSSELSVVAAAFSCLGKSRVMRRPSFFP
jgi:hypothetical protein